MINELPTIFEVVTGTTKKQAKEKSSVSNHSSSKSKSNSKVTKNFCRPRLCAPFVLLFFCILPFSIISWPSEILKK